MSTTTLLATISGIALVIASLSVITLHFGETKLNPIRDAVSIYVHARLGFLYFVQVIATGISTLTLLAALISTGDHVSRYGLVALGIYGAARVTIALFPADREPPYSSRGRVHIWLAVVTFVSISFAVGLLTRGLVVLPAWHAFDVPLRAASILTIVCSVILFPSAGMPGVRAIFGVIERGIYLGAFVWLGCAILGLLH